MPFHVTIDHQPTVHSASSNASTSEVGSDKSSNKTGVEIISGSSTPFHPSTVASEEDEYAEYPRPWRGPLPESPKYGISSDYQPASGSYNPTHSSAYPLGYPTSNVSAYPGIDPNVYQYAYPPTYQSAPYPSAPYPSDPYPSAPYSSAPYSSAPYSSAPYSSAPYSSAPYPSAPYPSAPYPSAPYSSAPYSSAPYPPFFAASYPNHHFIQPAYALPPALPDRLHVTSEQQNVPASEVNLAAPNEYAKVNVLGQHHLPGGSENLVGGRNAPFQAKKPLRQNTGDINSSYGSGKRVRFTIPLRHRKIPLVDEEKDIKFPTSPRSHSKNRDDQLYWTSRRSLPQEHYDIVQTRWIPDDDGRENVTLTIQDKINKGKESGLPHGIRWLHMTSAAPAFREFKDQVVQTPGLEGDEIALIVRLLNKVQKTNEQQYIHGRYFEPVTLTYDGEDPDDMSSLVSKTATFICLPFFDLDHVRNSNNTKENQTHPVRALLQTRYRLESTSQRDQNQVIRKIQGHNDLACIQLPQLWALIINENLMVTCAPFKASFLCGDSIKLLLHSRAKMDDAALSIGFTNLSGNKYFIPVRNCGTWFGLIDQITTPEFVPMAAWNISFIREQLLNGGPLYKLMDSSDGEIASEESWSRMLRAKKEDGLSLVLKEKDPVARARKFSQVDTGSIYSGQSWPMDDEVMDDDESVISIKVTMGSGLKTGDPNNQATKDKTPLVFRAQEPSRSRSRLRYSGPLVHAFPDEALQQQTPNALNAGEHDEKVNNSSSVSHQAEGSTRNQEQRKTGIPQATPKRPESTVNKRSNLRSANISPGLVGSAAEKGKSARREPHQAAFSSSSNHRTHQESTQKNSEQTHATAQYSLSKALMPPAAYQAPHESWMFGSPAQFIVPQYVISPTSASRNRNLDNRIPHAYGRHSQNQLTFSPYTHGVVSRRRFHSRNPAIKSLKSGDLCYTPSSAQMVAAASIAERKSTVGIGSLKKREDKVDPDYHHHSPTSTGTKLHSSIKPTLENAFSKPSRTANNDKARKGNTTDRPKSLKPDMAYAEPVTEDEQQKADQRRCHRWMELCNDVLGRRREMTEFPEPPHWPCRRHDQHKANRALNACVCNLRHIYDLLGLEVGSLRIERMRWHPDRFSSCDITVRENIQSKAEELYKELEQVIPKTQEQQSTATTAKPKVIMPAPLLSRPSHDTRQDLINQGDISEEHLELQELQSAAIVHSSLTDSLLRRSSLISDLGFPPGDLSESFVRTAATSKGKEHDAPSSFDVFQYLDDSWSSDSTSTTVSDSSDLSGTKSNDTRDSRFGKQASANNKSKHPLLIPNPDSATKYKGLLNKHRQATVEDDADMVTRTTSKNQVDDSSSSPYISRLNPRTIESFYSLADPAGRDSESSSTTRSADSSANATAGSNHSSQSVDDDLEPAEEEDSEIPIFLWSTRQSFTDVPSLTETSLSPVQDRAQSILTSDMLNEGFTANQTEAMEEVPVVRSNPNEVIMKAILAECHDRLRKSKMVEDVKMYNTVAERDEQTVIEAAAYLKARANGNENISENRLEGKVSAAELLVQKERIFVLATKLLRAFVPPQCDADILRKYWGAIYTLLIAAEAPDGDLTGIEFHLWSFRRLIQSILMGVRGVEGQRKVHYQIPRALPTAFQRLVMLLVAGSATILSVSLPQYQSRFQIFERCCLECEQSMLDGRNQLILMVHTDDYREHAGYEAVDSAALLSIMMRNLLDVSHKKSNFHLTDIYSEYTAKIQSMVRESASVRVYTDIELLSEELEVIQTNLDKQGTTLWDFKSTLDYYEGTSELGHKVLDRMLTQLQRQGEDFRELQRQADLARHRAAQSISIRAESNNKAILVFTVVTIIFLPLSFVTSYLGMNTADLRNTSSNQGLFWATGLPVTLFVFSVALVAAYLEQITSFFRSLIVSKDREKLD